MLSAARVWETCQYLVTGLRAWGLTRPSQENVLAQCRFLVLHVYRSPVIVQGRRKVDGS